MVRSTPIQKVKCFSLAVMTVFSVLPLVLKANLDETKASDRMYAICIAVLCILAAAYAFAAGRRFAPMLKHGLPSVAFGSAVCGFAMLTVLMSSVYFTYFVEAQERISDVNPTISLLLKLFTLIAAVYFLLQAAFPPLYERKALALLLALTPVLFCAFYILGDFINHSTMPLANGGGYRLLGIIGAMLFFLREAKFQTGKGGASLYYAVGHVAVILLFTYNAPILMQFFHGETSPTDALYAMLSLTFALYIIIRLLSLGEPVQEIPQILPEETAEAPAEETAEDLPEA